eukprot:gene28885-34859_t
MEFPFNTTILWDRTGYGAPKSIKHFEKVSPITLLPYDIQDLLTAASGLNFDHQAEFTLQLFHRNVLKQRHILSPFAMHSLGNSKLCFIRVNNASPVSCMALSVPLSSYAEAHNTNGKFSLAKVALLQNLAKSISTGRGFCLKHFVRIVASTHKKHPDDSQTTLDETARTFHFEAIVPSISFQALCINAIPILNSALCNNIMQARDVDPAYRMGYFSMNQTRKLVPLLQDDACLCVAPIVGVWVKFNIAEDLAGQSLQAAFDEALQHPLTWAAAVRYLYSDRVVHRQFVAEDTFLVVIFADEHMRYFEFTYSVGRGRVVDKVPYPFALLDFTVNLQHPDEGSAVDESKMDPLMCQFKQVFDISTVDITVRNTASRHLSSSYNFSERSFSDLSEAAPLPRSAVPLPSPSPQKPPAASSHPRVEQEEDRFLPVAPGAYSSLHVALKHQGQLSALPHSGVLSTAAHMDPHALASPELQFSFPAEVIAAQQRQIEALTEQVASLQRLVEKLTMASLPAQLAEKRNQVEASQISMGSSSALKDQPLEQVSILSMRSKSEQNAPPAFAASPQLRGSASQPPPSTWADVLAKEESMAIENEIMLAASKLEHEEDDDGASHDAENNPADSRPTAPAVPPVDDGEMSYMSLDTLGGGSLHHLRNNVRGAHERVSMYETESIMAIEAKYLNMK